MTDAVCFKCGDMKKGAFVTCRTCGSRPKDNDELIISLAITDHFLDASALGHVSADIANGEFPKIDPDSKLMLMRQIQEMRKTPAGRLALGEEVSEANKSNKFPWWPFSKKNSASSYIEHRPEVPAFERDIHFFESTAFKSWGVKNPSAAHRLRLRLAFSASTSSFLLDRLGNHGLITVENLQKSLINASRPLSANIESIFSTATPDHSVYLSMEKFISHISIPGVSLERETRIDGATALAGLINAFGYESASWIDGRSKGPFGHAGAIGILMHDLTVGGKTDATSVLPVGKAFMEVLVNITNE